MAIKTPQQIAAMRHGGKILGKILLALAKNAQPGITTKELDNQSRVLMEQYKVKPSFLGYHGFTATICTPKNEEVVHTIPDDRPLREGDVLTIDCGVIHEGFHTDSAITVGIGEINDTAKKMIETGEKALHKAISLAKDGTPIKILSRAIQQTVENNGYWIVRELVGHGIGTNLHEDPMIPNFEADAPNFKLKAGMTIAIEPIFTAGKAGIKTLSDGWNIVTKDRSLGMQVEHTILITENGSEILTGREALDPVYSTFKQS